MKIKECLHQIEKTLKETRIDIKTACENGLVKINKK